MLSSLASHPVPLQDVGVSIHRDRRRFTAAFKLKILEEAARCVAPGALGALLRREGLYSSHLAAWRAAAKAGALSGPTRRRGPKPTPPDPQVHRILELERALATATARAEHAEALVDLQKKVAALLGRPLPPADAPSETR